jgi:hypothetical protein
VARGDQQDGVVVGAVLPDAVVIAKVACETLRKGAELGLGNGLGWVRRVDMEDCVLLGCAVLGVCGAKSVLVLQCSRPWRQNRPNKSVSRSSWGTWRVLEDRYMMPEAVLSTTVAILISSRVWVS